MTLRRRLLLLSVAAATLTLTVSLVSAFTFLHLVSERRTLVKEIDPATITTGSLLTAYLDEETSVRGYVLSGNVAFLETFAQSQADVRDLTDKLSRTIGTDPQFRGPVGVLMQRGSQWENQFALPAWSANAAQLRTFATPTAQQAARQGFQQIRAGFTALQTQLDRARTTAIHTLDRRNQGLTIALLGVLLVVLGAAVVLWSALRAWVLVPLRGLASDVREVTAGNLARPVGSRPAPPEMQEFGGHLEAMRERIVGELETVTTARAELATLNEDLARSNVELEQFAYVASHDLQEPLRKVISFCQLLEERYRGQLDERADQYINFAVDGAKRMQVLINDLLAFSRVGRTTEKFVLVDLTACAEAAVGNLADRIVETSADVRVGDLPQVQGDDALLTALFQNLIGNAIKFRSAKPPTVAVAALGSDDDSWTITVSDNGIGIEPRFAERVFVIFQRLHGREAYAGTGIGLAMCRKIVEFHGGRIWLDTDFRDGTRFAFTLPVLAASSAPRVPQIASA